MKRWTSATLCVLAFCLLLRTLTFGQNPVTEAVRKVSELNGQLLKDLKVAPPEVRQAVDQVPQVSPTEVHQIEKAQPATRKIDVVSDNQKQVLVTAVRNFSQQKQNQAKIYSRLEIFFLIAGAVLALVGGIFNLMKLNTIAGIVSLIVVAVVGFPNVFPVAPLADFYTALATQALALETDCELKNPFTEDDYNSSQSQLKYLILYDANNRPKFGTTKVSTEDLVKHIQTYKTATDVATTGGA
jgi:DNA-binding transcriptional regulator YdaS (Cro superfamily)